MEASFSSSASIFESRHSYGSFQYFFFYFIYIKIKKTFIRLSFEAVTRTSLFSNQAI